MPPTQSAASASSGLFSETILSAAAESEQKSNYFVNCSAVVDVLNKRIRTLFSAAIPSSPRFFRARLRAGGRGRQQLKFIELIT